jgi:hypothetical protein
MLFCRQYFSPLNTFMRKGKDPDPTLSLMDPDPGGPKTCRSESGSPTLGSSVADPDPYVFGLPGSVSTRNGSGSGSLYHQAKIKRKILMPLFCDFFMTFYL